MRAFSVAAGTASTSTPRSSLSSRFEASEVHEADSFIEFYEKVDVAGSCIFAPGDTPEHPDVAGSPLGGRLDDRQTTLPEPPSEARVGQAERPPWCRHHIEHQLMTGRLDDESSKGLYPGLTSAGLARADHRLGNPGSARHICLRDLLGNHWAVQSSRLLQQGGP